MIGTKKKKINSKNRKTFVFDIITLFPKIFDPYFSESILGRAQKTKKITIKTYNLRDYTGYKRKQVDDTPYGGGAGMVLMAEPILKALEKINRPQNQKTKVIIFSAKGQPFSQKKAEEWAKKYRHLIFVSGRYEGIDERVAEITKAEEISIGPYVLTDGDVAAMAVISAVARLVPGVIKIDSLKEESHGNRPLRKTSDSKSVEYPHYTRPETLSWKGKKYRVPKILLSGDHKKIDDWRKAR